MGWVYTVMLTVRLWAEYLDKKFFFFEMWVGFFFYIGRGFWARDTAYPTGGRNTDFEGPNNVIAEGNNMQRWVEKRERESKEKVGELTWLTWNDLVDVCRAGWRRGGLSGMVLSWWQPRFFSYGGWADKSFARTHTHTDKHTAENVTAASIVLSWWLHCSVPAGDLNNTE